MTGNSGYFVLGAAEIAFLKWFRLFLLSIHILGKTRKRAEHDSETDRLFVLRNIEYTREELP